MKDNLVAKRRNLPPIDYLNECLAYCPATGIVIWKERPRHHFKTLVAKDRWNRMYAEQDAGTIQGNGISINITQGSFPLATVAFKLHTQMEPIYVGHRNRQRGDLRFDNLVEFQELRNYNAQCLPSSKYNPGDSITYRKVMTDRRPVYRVEAGDHLFVVRSTQEQASSQVDYLKEKLL